MNSYQHGFQVGFNWWMVFAVVAVGIMILTGLMQYRRRNSRILEYGDSWSTTLIAVALGLVFAVWLMIESGDGIVQMLDNNLTSDVYAWQSVVGAPFVALAAGGGFAAILYAVGRLTAFIKLGYLRSEMNGWQRIQSKRDAKRMTARQGYHYKMARPDYRQSVTVIQMAERKGSQLHRARVICDEDWREMRMPSSNYDRIGSYTSRPVRRDVSERPHPRIHR